MQNASHPDSQCLNQRDFWSSPVVRASTPTAIAILTAILGTTVTLTLTYEHPTVSTSVASGKTAVKQPSVQPPELDVFKDILSQVNQPIKELPGLLDPTSSLLDNAIAPLASNQLHKPKRQSFLDNSLSWYSDSKTEDTTLTRSPQAQSNLMANLQASSELTSVLDVGLKLAHTLQHYPVAKLNSPQLLDKQAAESVVEANSEQNQQESAPKAQQVELTVRDVVALAVENDKDIKNAYLEKIAQRQGSGVAEDKVVPNSTEDESRSSLVSTPYSVLPTTEQRDSSALKSQLTDKITNALLGYRELLRAQERVKIEQRSLELAQQLLDGNRDLIEAGKLSSADLIHSKVAVANRQLSLLTAQSHLVAAKLTLLDNLGIDQDVNIVSAETPIAEPTALDADQLKQLAFENQPDYQHTQLMRETANREPLLSEDNQPLNENLIASLNNTGNTTSDVQTGLGVTPESGDLAKEERIERSQSNLPDSESTLETSTDSLEIRVSDRIRDVKLSFAQVEQARQTAILFEQQLEIEREKHRLGEGSGISELVKLQNHLAQARNAELDATIDYLNGLTRLDQTLGTTLETWQVKIEKE